MSLEVLRAELPVCGFEILREKRENVARRPACYHLCRNCFALPQYYVGILYAGERAAAYLGTNKERAARVFALLVRGRVTPCTLQDVVSDMEIFDRAID